MFVIIEIDDRMPFADAELMLNGIKEQSKGFIKRSKIILGHNEKLRKWTN